MGISGLIDTSHKSGTVLSILSKNHFKGWHQQNLQHLSTHASSAAMSNLGFRHFKSAHVQPMVTASESMGGPTVLEVDVWPSV